MMLNLLIQSWFKSLSNNPTLKKPVSSSIGSLCRSSVSASCSKQNFASRRKLREVVHLLKFIVVININEWNAWEKVLFPLFVQWERKTGCCPTAESCWGLLHSRFTVQHRRNGTLFLCDLRHCCMWVLELMMAAVHDHDQSWVCIAQLYGSIETSIHKLPPYECYGIAKYKPQIS